MTNCAAVDAQTDELVKENMFAPSPLLNLRVATIQVNDEGQFIVALGQTKIDNQPEGSPESADVKIIEALESDFESVSEAGVGQIKKEYTILVPYTEMKAGKPQQKYRSETRKRTVQVPDAQDKKIVDFQTNSSKSQHGSDPLLSTFQKESTRMVIPKDHDVIYRRTITSLSFGPKDIQFFDLAGKVVGADEAVDRIDIKAPVVLLDEPEPTLDSFYSEILNPQTLLVYIKPITLENAIKKATAGK